MMERPLRRRRVNPQHDAEKHIKLQADKAGIIEQFINPYKGRGVFATEIFYKGDFVLEYRGKLLQQEPCLHTKKDSDVEEVFLFDFQWKGNCWCLDASVEDKSLGRLANDDHKNPNCKMKTIEVGGIPHLCLFAIRDIVTGEEITYNYGDAAWPWRKKKSHPEVHQESDDDTTRSQKSHPEVHQESDDDTTRSQKSHPEVHQESDDDTTRSQKSHPEVHQESDDDTTRSQKSHPEVHATS
ncbi:N-lysine methyltransferase KMT5A-A-like isoform X2 [Melanotaenia boesemani]|uniref:N-lysine methyltransferase KMT5A-A-like isoform X2 n=1 Tax=Melanotaenia boesemani TaxID=1250792 RepID=UPI001C0504E5|nr:N-lysine methyltransferase KMT5A-A-like isoform X2 [Melanotaenia boesemani]